MVNNLDCDVLCGSATRVRKQPAKTAHAKARVRITKRLVQPHGTAENSPPFSTGVPAMRVFHVVGWRRAGYCDCVLLQDWCFRGSPSSYLGPFGTAVVTSDVCRTRLQVGKNSMLCGTTYLSHFASKPIKIRQLVNFVSARGNGISLALFRSDYKAVDPAPDES